MGRRPTVVEGLRIAFAVLSLTLGVLVGVGCGGKKDTGSSGEAAESGGMVVREGDRVQVQYTGMMDEGVVFDQSDPEVPLEFVVGSGQIIPGFDRAVVGMNLGEEKTVAIEPKDAYGERDDEMVAVLARSDLPAEYEPEKGMGIRLQDNMGRPVPGTIVVAGEDSIRVDLNHPLAGKTLTFKIKIVGILERME